MLSQTRGMIAAYTCICEEDSIWIDQYLKEAERLNIPFSIYLDRCSKETKEKFSSHELCVAVSEQNNPKIEFNERHKQTPFDEIVNLGFKWAMAWDIDETYEPNAQEKLKTIETLEADLLDVHWLNLWDSPTNVRIDGPFSGGHRVKFYNLESSSYSFKQPTVNGAYATKANVKTVKNNLICLHWGMMTHEMRQQHKDRWDRIYGKVGGNPYGFWNFSLDYKNYPPTIDSLDHKIFQLNRDKNVIPS